MSGKVEIAFQHPAVRPPFDDLTLRDEFRPRLNTAIGVDLPLGKLQMRPSFPLTCLADPHQYDTVLAAMAWFMTVANNPHDA